MSIFGWSPSEVYGTRELHEREFRRASLPAWDARWHALSVPARFAFIGEIRIAAPHEVAHPMPALEGVPSRRFAPEVLEELTRVGFVKFYPTPIGMSEPGVFPAQGVRDFVLRVRRIRECHLLSPAQPDLFKSFVAATCFTRNLQAMATQLLQQAGINEYLTPDELLDRYVRTHHWVGWILEMLEDHCATAIVKAVVAASSPLELVALSGKIKGAGEAAVRSSLDLLIAHLVLFEDVDPETLEIRVGLLPPVREQLIAASKPRPRPPLVVCANPKDQGPDEGVIVSDLRAFLLEVASTPPRLRQSLSLFQKEAERFEKALEPLPPWLVKILKLTPAVRVQESRRWAFEAKLVQTETAGKAIYLQLSPRGQQWLIASLDDQHVAVFEGYRALKTSVPLMPEDIRDNLGAGYDPLMSRNDSHYLGMNVVALPAEKRERWSPYRRPTPEETEPLRKALCGVFSALPIGTYHRLDSLVAHAASGADNPLLLGTGDARRVVIYHNAIPVPALPERIEETGRRLILEFVLRRLIPLGCVRVAVDDQGALCVAREPRLDAYFGRPIPRDARTAAAQAESKVVVQPDFSVVIIGASPGPAAELLPFCERQGPGSGRGALVLKLTRAAFVQAVAKGLPPADVLVRLKRRASHELPANVVREIEGWSRWVRHIVPESKTLLRCPDREAAERIMGVLRQQGERLSDTVIAVAFGSLTTVERQKLRGEGILIASERVVAPPASGPQRAAPKKAARRRRGFG